MLSEANGTPCECYAVMFKDAPLFVTKHALLRQRFPTIKRVHWAMGDDTFVRLLDPKYYGGDGGEAGSKALAAFFTDTQLFVFLRHYASVAEVWAEVKRRRLVEPSEAQRTRIQFCTLPDARLRQLSSTHCRRLLARAEYAALKELLSPHVYALFVDRPRDGGAEKEEAAERAAHLYQAGELG